ncbi:MAG: DUF418 domain-containing protein [Anaerolineae bacterium]
MTAISPTRAADRIEVIDILRGLAIFGILMVNMHYFVHPWATLMAPEGAPFADAAAAWVINAFFTGKFFPIFSFLFGLGMSIQMDRAAAKDVRFGPLYARRLGLLLLFGLAHGILLWIGDILTLYALLGFVLLLFFRKTKPRTNWIWAVILVGLLTLLTTLSIASLQFAMTIPEAASQIEATFAESAAITAASVEEGYIVYATGSWVEITAQRAEEFLMLSFAYVPFIAPSVLAMFLIGQAMGKAGRFKDIEGNLPFFRRLMLWALPIGLVMNIIFASSGVSLAAQGGVFDWTFLLAFVMNTIGGPVLALGYISAVVVIYHKTRTQILGVLAPVGRMALTNYLMHSIIWTTVFYGYGLGLYGQIGAAVGLGLTLLTYAVQIPFSHWWMSRYRFGPFEWLWRSLTYMQPQPMRRQAPAGTG